MTKRKNGRVAIAIIDEVLDMDAADIAAMFKRPRRSGKSRAAAEQAVAEAWRKEGINHAFVDEASGS